MSEDNQPIISTLRVLNTSAIKAHALKCSRAYRSAKFTRVGEAFLVEVQADVEAKIRQLAGENMPTIHAIVEPEPGANFVSGNAQEKLCTAFNGWVSRLIQAKVQRHPSTGVTLVNTR